MPRLFTGLEIPAEIGQSLSNLRGGLPGARWIDPENYHVTLRFIGDIDGMSANEIASMLFRVDRKPFEVKVQGLTSFGGRKPRAVVATIAPSKPLMELQAELERMMQRIGLDRAGSDQGLILLVEGIGRVGGLHAALSAPDSQKLQAVNRGRRYANASDDSRRRPRTHTRVSRSVTRTTRRNPRPHMALRRSRRVTRTARTDRR